MKPRSEIINTKTKSSIKFETVIDHQDSSIDAKSSNLYERSLDFEGSGIIQSNKITEFSSPTWEKGLKFLIVDDTKTNRKMTNKLLSSLGHSVDEACDGLEFLSKLNISTSCTSDLSRISDFYDIVLMDDNMPNMTGPEATKCARQNGYKGIIYGVTGNSHYDQIEHFKKSGANEIFEKPLDLEKLKLCFCRQIIDSSFT
jgi:CheY-like chemotaxis protein